VAEIESIPFLNFFFGWNRHDPYLARALVGVFAIAFFLGVEPYKTEAVAIPAASENAPPLRLTPFVWIPDARMTNAFNQDGSVWVHLSGLFYCFRLRVGNDAGTFRIGSPTAKSP